MKLNPLRHIGVALASALVLSSLALAPINVQAAPVSVSIDTSDKQSVQDAYFDVFQANVNVPSGWNGNLDTCTAGTSTDAARDATINVINYYRALAGLNPVIENTAATAQAQQAALIFAASQNISHFVDPSDYDYDWKCLTTTGTDAAGQSNVAYGYPTSGQSIAGYMDDSGTNNWGVGHRSWLLYPLQSEVGIGMAGTSYPTVGYDLKLWGTDDMQDNTRPDGNVSWPTKGYFPAQNLPASGRWSYSAPGVDFNSGVGQGVTVTKNGTPVDVSTIKSSWYGDPTLVWTMPTITNPAPGTVDTYHVTITGAVNTEYDINVFTAMQTVKLASVAISGTPAVGSTLTATASGLNPSDADVTYAWYRDSSTTPIATGSTYKVGLADAGHSLTVMAIGSKTDWLASDPVTSSAVAIPALIPLTGTVTSTDGSPVTGVVVAYNNVACATNADLTDPDHVGTVTVPSDGSFSIGTIGGQCYAISVSSPTDLLVTVNGLPTTAYVDAGATDVAISVTHVTLGAVTIPASVPVDQTITGTVTSYWPTTATLTYQWLRDDQAISGATSVDYTATGADYGHQLSLRVTASAGGYTATATSGKATVALGAAITYIPPITGTPVVGQTLTTSVPAGWTPVYQWLREGQEIPGATDVSYALVADDANTRISVHVTLTRLGYAPVEGTATPVTVKNVYTVSFDPQNGADPTQISVVDGDAAALPADPARQWFTFGGWFPNADGTGTQFTATTPVSADITLYAKWTPVPTHTIAYDANGGTGTMADPTVYHEGESATILANGFTREGFSFTGWNTVRTGTGVQYAPGTSFTVTADLVLYAQWHDDSVPLVTYAVTYDANGGTGTMADPTAYAPGSQARAKQNAFTRDGYTFAGWNTMRDGTGTAYSAGAAIPMNDNVTLYAQWTKAGTKAVETGGRASNSSMLLLIELGLITAGVAVFRLRKLV